MAEQKKEPKRAVTAPKSSEKKAGAGGSFKRLFRSKRERAIAGVCGGLAEYLQIDPIIVRVLWVVSALIGGFTVLLYIAGWVIIPENPDEPVASKKKTGDSHKEDTPRNTSLVWGLALIAIGAFFLIRHFHWYDYFPFSFDWPWDGFWFSGFRFSYFWPLLIIAVGALYVFSVLKNDKSETGDVKTKTKAVTGDSAMQKKLTRSTKEKMIGGVCGGLGEYFNVDPTIIRIGWAILSLVTSVIPGIIAYIVMLIVVPEDTAVDSPSTPSAKTPSSKSDTTAKARTQK